MSTYTDEQIQSAKHALMMWSNLPCNPCGVSLALNKAIVAEFEATKSMARDAINVGPVVIIRWALEYTLTNNQATIDVVDLIAAVRECEKRAAFS